MIVNFRHKGLKLFFFEGDTRGFSSSMQERVNNILTALHMADKVKDMDRPRFRRIP
jgi:plasmid maintenance system killer protein